MMARQTWESRYIEDNLEELFPGLSIEEALDQESLFQSLQISSRSYDHGQSRSYDREQSSSQGHSWGDSSRMGSSYYDYDMDEALARSLQELESYDDVGHVSSLEPARSTASTSGRVATGSSVSQVNQDDVDPDAMSYEELQNLGESIGSETRGLSEAEISRLPNYKYKCGFFSKKPNIDDCAICCAGYKNKQTVVCLPCTHKYHKECIKKWLMQKRTCPMCQKEVEV